MRKKWVYWMQGDNVEDVREEAISTVRELTVDPERKWGWEISITQTYKKRSRAQHNLYHVWARAISDEVYRRGGKRLGIDEVKLSLQFEILGEETIIGLDDAPYTRVRSTTGLNVREMAEFMEQVDAYCVTAMDFELPRPEDSYYMELMEQEQ